MFLIVQYYWCNPSFHKNLVPKFPTDCATFFGNSHIKIFSFNFSWVWWWQRLLTLSKGDKNIKTFFYNLTFSVSDAKINVVSLNLNNNGLLCGGNDVSVEVCAQGRVSVRGVKSLGSHFACLCRGFEFYEVKKKKLVIIF